MCYITGNKVDPQGDLDPNFAGYDDVDGGRATLTTPLFDLSKLKSPYIRFWYYFSNDQGLNPGICVWETDISNDDGATWKSVQRTTNSTNAASGYPQWTEFSFPLRDYALPSSSVKIRFIASDYTLGNALVEAVVEAGVDDLEILDVIDVESGVVNITPAAIVPPYPNPIHRGERLHLSASENGTHELTDILGRRVALSLGNEFVIPFDIIPGIYFINDGRQTYKILIAE
jgi:hypothetical protein